MFWLLEDRRRQGGIRQHASLDRSGEGKNCHLSSARIEENFGTFMDGRASGEDVIDEQDTLAEDLPGIAQGKRVTKVLQTGRTRERDLRIGIDGPEQVPIGDRSLQDRTNAVGEEQRLIELSLTEAVRMERDRHEQVCVQISGDRLSEQHP